MLAEGNDDVRVLHVRAGEIAGAGPWLYAWLRLDSARPVVYVGTAPMPIDARTWLHLNDADPEIGRVAASYPAAASEPLDVLAVRLPDTLSRPEAKAAFIGRLAAAELLSDAYVGDPPAGTSAPTAAAPYADRLLAAISRRADATAAEQKE